MNGSVERFSVIIVGSGFGGLGMGIRLKQAGVDDFVILEQDDGVGGTWRANRYPGAACDIESHLYSFSFEPNPEWTRTFAPQAEILDYLERCATKYGLRPHLRFGRAVVGATFDEAAGEWTVETGRGEVLRARALVSACGGLSRPSLPDIPGLRSFQGKLFHTARWDGSLDLSGKRVGVIGTGASAIQIVPSIAPTVGKLHVYQRTPPWILPKQDPEIPVDRRAQFRRWPGLQQLARAAQFWRHELLAFAFTVEPRVLKQAQKLGLQHLGRTVRDPQLRRKLTPSYTMGCKRILLSNDYYPAFNRPNVELVTDGIAEVRAHGILSRDGSERALDAIVLATGFQAAESVAPFEVRGRGGRELNEAWREGAEAFLGTTVSGFPNLFMIVGPNTGLGHSSMVLMIESQITYILSCLALMRSRGAKLLDVRADAQRRYNAQLHTRLARTVWATGGCTSWYRTSTGKNTTLWPGFTLEYRFRTRRVSERDYTLVPASAEPAEPPLPIAATA